MDLHIFGAGTRNDRNSLALDSCQGNHIDNEMRFEKPRAGMLEIAAQIERNFTSVRLISASARYNCFGLALASRRTCIVDGETAFKALTEDGYRRLPWDPTQWEAGDIVLYSTPTERLTHVSVIVTKSVKEQAILVLSAWGDNGEYLHPLDPGHPVLGSPFAVYSKRVTR